jgi:lysozyme
MARDIMKEFLVSIGFETDSSSYRDFQNKLDKVTKQFVELSAVVATAAAEIGVMVTKTAADMTRLYFASERAGTSIQNLMAIKFAGSQIGIGADQMAAAVERMASTLRSNPQMAIFFGGKPNADATQNFIALLTKLQAWDAKGPLGHVMAANIAQMFGISEPEMVLLLKQLPELIRAQREFKEAAARAGVDVNKLGPEFTKFTQDLGKLWQSVELLGIAFGGTLLPFAEKLVHALQTAVDFMLRLNAATHGISTAIAGIGLALTAAMGGAAAVAGGLAAVGVGGAAVAGGLAGGALIAIVATVAAIALAWFLSHTSAVSKVTGAVSGMIAGAEGFSSRVYRDIAGHATIGWGHLVKAGENFSGGITQAGAAALLATDTASAQAAVLRLVHATLNSNQFAALSDLVYNIGPTAFAKSTMLRELNAGDFGGAAGEFARWNKVMIDGGYQASAALTSRRLGERDLFNTPVTQQNNVNIRVEGVSDPKEAGRVIDDNQRRVNGDALRNLKGALK